MRELLLIVRYKIAYSFAGKIISRRYTAGTSCRAHWLRQEWAEGTTRMFRKSPLIALVGQRKL